MGRLNGRAPTSQLIEALARAGWGPLSGREFQGVRSCLRAVASLPAPTRARGVFNPRRHFDLTGYVVGTAPQVADAAGLSERWVRCCLHFLDEIGLVLWERSGLDFARPMPGKFRISKSKLAALVHQARAGRDRLLVKRREKTARRIARARAKWLQKKRGRAGQAGFKVELDASLSTIKSGRRTAPSRCSSTTGEKERILKKDRAQRAQTRAANRIGGTVARAIELEELRRISREKEQLSAPYLSRANREREHDALARVEFARVGIDYDAVKHDGYLVAVLRAYYLDGARDSWTLSELERMRKQYKEATRNA